MLSIVPRIQSVTTISLKTSNTQTTQIIANNEEVTLGIFLVSLILSAHLKRMSGVPYGG